MKLRQISIFTVCAASILLAFQNCSKTNFKAASADTTASSTSPPTPGPDSNKSGYSTALQDLRPIYYHLDMAGDGNQTLYVVSACGNFVSHDQGSTFAPVAMTGITSMITSISVDGANIYAGTSTDGLFASHDGGQTFQNILNLSKVKAITLKSCTQVSFGTSFGISQVYASGQTIVAGTYGAGVLVSHDGGQTFSGSQLSSGGTTLFLQSPSKIFASGNDIYMTVAGVQQPSGNPYPACTGQVSVPAFGLLVSHDNGDTFMALSAAGEWGFSAVATGSNIYFLGLKGIGTSQVQTGVALSSDSGQTFTYYYNNNNSPVNPSSPPDTSMSGVPISLGASALFTLTGPSKSVMRSTDSARTFSPVVIDSSVSDMIVSSLHQQGQALFVLTNHGLYVSSDNGQNFSHRSFSSDFCAYPWWAANNISASASGNVVYAGWDRHLLTSTDGGT
ncbi:MAG: WD40/YVTN/BNR-like repeat-containing protein, partial [Bdellovibrionales bacterium]